MLHLLLASQRLSCLEGRTAPRTALLLCAREASEAHRASTLAACAEYLRSARFADGDGVQRCDFLRDLWGVDSIPALSEEVLSDPTRVLATIYDIGGPYTSILSMSVQKKLPMIAHIGIRCYNKEYCYSDHVEVRPVQVMQEIMRDNQQVTLDLGPAKLSEEELNKLLSELEADWQAQDYNMFDKNCNHFALLLASKASENGFPTVLSTPVLDITKRMLDALPEWRRKLGEVFMTQITFAAVVGWAWFTRSGKERQAAAFGLDAGR